MKHQSTKNTFNHKKHAGRNHLGSIVVRHRNSGTKKNNVIIDFKRKFNKLFSVCYKFVYDNNRSSLVALLKYANGSYTYILAPQGLFYGDIVRSVGMNSMFNKGFVIGDCVLLKRLPIETVFFNLEIKVNRGAQYARSAGNYCTIISEDEEKHLHTVKLPTGSVITISSSCVVTLGKSSNPIHYKTIIGKAGINRKKGIRPTVRGVAMNPVDHPHGGRTKTSSPEVTPWGKIAKFNK